MPYFSLIPHFFFKKKKQIEREAIMRQSYIAGSIFSLSQIDRIIDNGDYPTSRFLGILLRIMRMCSRKVLILILRRRTREINPPGREDEKIARQNLIQSIPKRIHQNPIKSSPVDPFQEFFLIVDYLLRRHFFPFVIFFLLLWLLYGYFICILILLVNLYIQNRQSYCI